jgi:hypothetical protein
MYNCTDLNICAFHTKNQWRSQVLRKGKQFLPHQWHPSVLLKFSFNVSILWLQILLIYDTRVYWQTNNDIPTEENWQSYLSLIIMFSVYFFCNISSCDILAWTDNTMDKRKRTKGQTTIFRTLHRKLKIEQHEHTKNQWRSQVLRKGKQFLPHQWHPSVLLKFS